MPSPRKPFRLNVGFLIHEEIGYSREFSWDVDEVGVGEDVEIRGLRGVAQIGRTPQGLLVQAEFSGETPLECVRCLKRYWQPLSWSFTELYAFDRRSVTESGLLVPEDANIDIEPLVREYALLEVPISPLHSRACAGLCPVCGQDLNVRDCGHRSSLDRSSPFAKLKGST